MDYRQALGFLYQLPGGEHLGKYKLGLKGIKNLLACLGNPEASLKAVHVAGTNGKGSTCMFISSIIKEAGFKVGTYLSPHVWDFRERFLLNGKKISANDFLRCFSLVKKRYRNQTYFEFLTAMAFVFFREQQVDYCVLETGLGGRLDATNVIKPLAAVITNVSLEHTHILGGTVEKIAKEKAGIIKPNVPVITGATGKALGVISRLAWKKKAPLYIAAQITKKPLRLRGMFQEKNAAIAEKTAEVLRDRCNIPIGKKEIADGLRLASIPGRLSFLSKNVLVDCAHNPDAIETLTKELRQIRKNFKKVILVMGILDDKDWKKMISTITPLADITILTKPKIPRAAEPKALELYVSGISTIIPSVRKAMAYARTIATPNDLIVATGSMYVVGEVSL